jgi:hypothetical protein
MSERPAMAEPQPLQRYVRLIAGRPRQDFAHTRRVPTSGITDRSSR